MFVVVVWVPVVFSIMSRPSAERSIKSLVTITLVMVGLCGLFWGASADRSQALCSCELARKTNGWCRECGVGYVASIQVPCAILFEALDAHGHTIDPNFLRCEACRQAVANDGFCDRSGIGFVRKQAYFSRLAYYTARENLRERSSIDCAVCKKTATVHGGWCAACKIGTVGDLTLRIETDLKEAQKAIETLQSALGKLATCETCAVAIVTGGRCPLCKVAYHREGSRFES